MCWFCIYYVLTSFLRTAINNFLNEPSIWAVKLKHISYFYKPSEADMGYEANFVEIKYVEK